MKVRLLAKRRCRLERLELDVLLWVGGAGALGCIEVKATIRRGRPGLGESHESKGYMGTLDREGGDVTGLSQGNSRNVHCEHVWNVG